jgi:hypothetical protein
VEGTTQRDNAPTHRRYYDVGDLQSAQLKVAIAEFFAEAVGDGRVRQDAIDAGVDLDAVLAAGPEEIEIEGEGKGFTGLEIAIAVMLLQEAGDRTWDNVIHPWLVRRKQKALGPQRDGPLKDPRPPAKPE